MILKYDPDDHSDRLKLAELEKYGIYLECDLFDHASIVIDTVKFRDSFRNSTSRTRKIDDLIRIRAKQMKEEGMTIRQIATELSISIGSASNFTKDR